LRRRPAQPPCSSRHHPRHPGRHLAGRGRRAQFHPALSRAGARTGALAACLASQFADPRAKGAVDRLERLPGDAPNRDASEWATIRVPTLVLGTRRDLIHPYAYAEALARAIPGASLKELTPKSISAERYQLDTQNAIDNFL